MRKLLFIAFVLCLVSARCFADQCTALPTCEELGYYQGDIGACGSYNEYGANYITCPYDSSFHKCVNYECQKIGFTADPKDDWCETIVPCIFDPNYTLCTQKKRLCKVVNCASVKVPDHAKGLFACTPQQADCSTGDTVYASFVCLEGYHMTYLNGTPAGCEQDKSETICGNGVSVPENAYCSEECTPVDKLGIAGEKVCLKWECNSTHEKSGSTCVKKDVCDPVPCPTVVKPAHSYYLQSSDCTPQVADCSPQVTVYTDWSCENGYHCIDRNKAPIDCSVDKAATDEGGNLIGPVECEPDCPFSGVGQEVTPPEGAICTLYKNQINTNCSIEPQVCVAWECQAADGYYRAQKEDGTETCLKKQCPENVCSAVDMIAQSDCKTHCTPVSSKCENGQTVCTEIMCKQGYHPIMSGGKITKCEQDCDVNTCSNYPYYSYKKNSATLKNIPDHAHVIQSDYCVKQNQTCNETDTVIYYKDWECDGGYHLKTTTSGNTTTLICEKDFDRGCDPEDVSVPAHASVPTNGYCYPKTKEGYADTPVVTKWTCDEGAHCVKKGAGGKLEVVSFTGANDGKTCSEAGGEQCRLNCAVTTCSAAVQKPETDPDNLYACAKSCIPTDEHCVEDKTHEVCLEWICTGFLEETTDENGNTTQHCSKTPAAGGFCNVNACNPTCADKPAVGASVTATCPSVTFNEQTGDCEMTSVVMAWQCDNGYHNVYDDNSKLVDCQKDCSVETCAGKPYYSGNLPQNAELSGTACVLQNSLCQKGNVNYYPSWTCESGFYCLNAQGSVITLGSGETCSGKGGVSCTAGCTPNDDCTEISLSAADIAAGWEIDPNSACLPCQNGVLSGSTVYSGKRCNPILYEEVLDSQNNIVCERRQQIVQCSDNGYTYVATGESKNIPDHAGPANPSDSCQNIDENGTTLSTVYYRNWTCDTLYHCIKKETVQGSEQITVIDSSEICSLKGGTECRHDCTVNTCSGFSYYDNANDASDTNIPEHAHGYVAEDAQGCQKQNKTCNETDTRTYYAKWVCDKNYMIGYDNYGREICVKMPQECIDSHENCHEATLPSDNIYTAQAYLTGPTCNYYTETCSRYVTLQTTWDCPTDSHCVKVGSDNKTLTYVSKSASQTCSQANATGCRKDCQVNTCSNYPYYYDGETPKAVAGYTNPPENSELYGSTCVKENQTCNETDKKTYYQWWKCVDTYFETTDGNGNTICKKMVEPISCSAVTKPTVSNLQTDVNDTDYATCTSNCTPRDVYGNFGNEVCEKWECNKNSSEGRHYHASATANGVVTICAEDCNAADCEKLSSNNKPVYPWYFAGEQAQQSNIPSSPWKPIPDNAYGLTASAGGSECVKYDTNCISTNVSFYKSFECKSGYHINGEACEQNCGLAVSDSCFGVACHSANQDPDSNSATWQKEADCENYYSNFVECGKATGSQCYVETSTCKHPANSESQPYKKGYYNDCPSPYVKCTQMQVSPSVHTCLFVEEPGATGEPTENRCNNEVGKGWSTIAACQLGESGFACHLDELSNCYIPFAPQECKRTMTYWYETHDTPCEQLDSSPISFFDGPYIYYGGSGPVPLGCGDSYGPFTVQCAPASNTQCLCAQAQNACTCDFASGRCCTCGEANWGTHLDNSETSETYGQCIPNNCAVGFKLNGEIDERWHSGSCSAFYWLEGLDLQQGCTDRTLSVKQGTDLFLDTYDSDGSELKYVIFVDDQENVLSLYYGTSDTAQKNPSKPYTTFKLETDTPDTTRYLKLKDVLSPNAYSTHKKVKATWDIYNRDVYDPNHKKNVWSVPKDPTANNRYVIKRGCSKSFLDSDNIKYCGYKGLDGSWHAAYAVRAGANAVQDCHRLESESYATPCRLYKCVYDLTTHTCQRRNECFLRSVENQFTPLCQYSLYTSSDLVDHFDNSDYDYVAPFVSSIASDNHGYKHIFFHSSVSQQDKSASSSTVCQNYKCREPACVSKVLEYTCSSDPNCRYRAGDGRSVSEVCCYDSPYIYKKCECTGKNDHITKGEGTYQNVATTYWDGYYQSLALSMVDGEPEDSCNCHKTYSTNLEIRVRNLGSRQYAIDFKCDKMKKNATEYFDASMKDDVNLYYTNGTQCSSNMSNGYFSYENFRNVEMSCDGKYHKIGNLNFSSNPQALISASITYMSNIILLSGDTRTPVNGFSLFEEYDTFKWDNSPSVYYKDLKWLHPYQTEIDAASCSTNGGDYTSLPDSKTCSDSNIDNCPSYSTKTVRAGYMVVWE